MWSRVCVTLVRQSICLSHRSTVATASGGFAAERPGCRRYRSIAAGAVLQALRRTALWVAARKCDTVYSRTFATRSFDFGFRIRSWLPPFCKQTLLPFTQPRWQLRRTYFFYHYTVFNEFAFTVQVKTQNKNYWLYFDMFVFTTGHFHTCVLCKECSLFPFLPRDAMHPRY